MHHGELSKDVSLARSSLTRLAVLNRKVMDINVFANAAASLTALRCLHITGSLLKPGTLETIRGHGSLVDFSYDVRMCITVQRHGNVDPSPTHAAVAKNPFVGQHAVYSG